MKTKLTPEIQAEIVKRLKIGCYAKTVVEAVGINRATYYRWLERGERSKKLAEEGKKIPKEEKIYCDFCDSVRQADAEGEVSITAMIFNQVKDDWRAGMELLARKYPERWARKEYIDFKGSVDQGYNPREEAFKEFEEEFKDVPRKVMSEIAEELNIRLRNEKEKSNKEKNK